MKVITQKVSWIIYLLAITLISSCSGKITESKIDSNSMSVGNQKALLSSGDEVPYSNFKLSYVSAGLGSNMGKRFPKFAVEGTHFNYTLEQNSYIGEQKLESEKVCEGEISESTIESIIELVENIEDSVIYETNIEIMSGSIQYIHIEHEEIDLLFELHNASHPIADKIVELLNAHIPDKHRPLYLWKD